PDDRTQAVESPAPDAPDADGPMTPQVPDTQVNRPNEPEPGPAAPATAHVPATGNGEGEFPRNGKAGAAAYDGVPEPRRTRLVKEWEEEVAKAADKVGSAKAELAAASGAVYRISRARDDQEKEAERLRKKASFDSIRQ